MAATEARKRYKDNSRIPFTRNLNLTASVPVYEGMFVGVDAGTGKVDTTSATTRFVGIAVQDVPAVAVDTNEVNVYNRPVIVEYNHVEELELAGADETSVGLTVGATDSNTLVTGVAPSAPNFVGVIKQWLGGNRVQVWILQELL